MKAQQNLWEEWMKVYCTYSRSTEAAPQADLSSPRPSYHQVQETSAGYVCLQHFFRKMVQYCVRTPTTTSICSDASTPHISKTSGEKMWNLEHRVLYFVSAILRQCSDASCVKVRESEDLVASCWEFSLKQARKNVRAVMIFQAIDERNEMNDVSTIRIKGCEHCFSSANHLLSNTISCHSVAFIIIRGAVEWLVMLVTCAYT